MGRGIFVNCLVLAVLLLCVRCTLTHNICSLYIRTDPTVWSHIREGIPGHDDPSKSMEVNEKTYNKIMSMISKQVSFANQIFYNTVFDGIHQHRNIQFVAQNVKIDIPEDCHHNGINRSPYCDHFFNKRDIMYKFVTSEDATQYCFAILLTYKDFNADFYGWTYGASPDDDNFRGVCATPEIGTSRNKGILTLVNKGNELSEYSCNIAFSQVIAYGFGAKLDVGACNDANEEGFYLMHNEPLEREYVINGKLSPCSIQNISKVLDAMVTGRRRNCFI